MESRLNHDSDRVEMLERQLKEARDLAAESDRKFEEVSSLRYIKLNQGGKSNFYELKTP